MLGCFKIDMVEENGQVVVVEALKIELRRIVARVEAMGEKVFKANTARRQ